MTLLLNQSQIVRIKVRMNETIFIAEKLNTMQTNIFMAMVGLLPDFKL